MPITHTVIVTYAAQVFAAEQSAVLQGLGSCADGAHFATESAGQATVDMDAMAAAASTPESPEAMDEQDGLPATATRSK